MCTQSGTPPTAHQRRRQPRAQLRTDYRPSLDRWMRCTELIQLLSCQHCPDAPPGGGGKQGGTFHSTPPRRVRFPPEPMPGLHGSGSGACGAPAWRKPEFLGPLSGACNLLARPLRRSLRGAATHRLSVLCACWAGRGQRKHWVSKRKNRFGDIGLRAPLSVVINVRSHGSGLYQPAQRHPRALLEPSAAAGLRAAHGALAERRATSAVFQPYIARL